MNLKQLALKVPKISYGDRIRPVRDWLAILAASAVLLIASIAWNAWFYYGVSLGEVGEAAAPTTSAPSLDALPEARAVLETRAVEAERYRSFYEFVDPS